MKNFLDRANQMVDEANISIKEYNQMIKDYEKKGFFGKMFAQSPDASETAIRSKKGVIDNLLKLESKVRIIASLETSFLSCTL